MSTTRGDREAPFRSPPKRPDHGPAGQVRTCRSHPREAGAARWWASAIVVAACTSPQIVPKPVCKPIAAACESAPDDATAFAFVQQHCWKCHAAGGIAEHEFTSVSSLRAAPIASMIGGCEMPPDGERPLDDAERAMLIAWASCPK